MPNKPIFCYFLRVKDKNRINLSKTKIYLILFQISNCTVKKHFPYFLLIIKLTRCTNFSNLFLEWNSTCFGQFLCPSSGVFHCTQTMVCVIQVCWQHASRIRMERSSILILLACCQQTCITYTIVCVQWKTPDDGQRNCPKHVEFHSKNKLEKLVHLVGFIIRNFTLYTVTWASNFPFLLQKAVN